MDEKFVVVHEISVKLDCTQSKSYWNMNICTESSFFPSPRTILRNLLVKCIMPRKICIIVKLKNAKTSDLK